MKYCTVCDRDQEEGKFCFYCGGILEEYPAGQEPEKTETEEERRARIEAERLALNDFDIIKGVLVKYLGKSEKVVIPRVVKEIGKEAFKNNTTIKEVVIPERTSVIGESAFSGCISLQEINISKNIQTILAGAFHCCGLIKVVVPGHLKVIDSNVFSNCSYLKEVVIEEGIECISAYAFWGCGGLDDVILPNGLRYIETQAFGNCTLYEVFIPDSVENIASNAFANSPHLLYVEIGKDTVFNSDSFDFHTEVVIRGE